MQCHESHWTGFASATPKRYKTIPRPARAASQNVRSLRPAFVDDDATPVAHAAETTAPESAAPSLDGYAWAAAVWLTGWISYGTDMFLYWSAATAIAMLITQKYARQWAVSLVILLLIKSYFLP